jgi:hypothetical protein
MISYKYPRTYHLPFSPAYNFDDERLVDMSNLMGAEVVITEKMDGECTTLYGDGRWHARSLDNSRKHVSRDWIANYWAKTNVVRTFPDLDSSDTTATFKYEFPKKWRICGENLYAKHSIHYTNLREFFCAFSIWDESNNCLDWDMTEDILRKLEIPTPPVMYEGTLSYDVMTSIASNIDLNNQEGFVVRSRGSFHYDDFQKHVAKWVRANHTPQDQKNWFKAQVVRNKLKV